MKILVTGGAGFIGSHVCDALLARGDKVICVDNFNDYYDPKIKENNIQHNLENINYTLFRADILNLDKMKSIFTTENPEKIIHLAARAGVRSSINDPELYYENNVKGTLNMLKLAVEFKVKNFIFGSSSSVYGNRKNVPFKETDKVDLPISPYAATKKSGEEMCYTYHHLYGLNVSCLRFFTVYGPRGRPDMAPLKFTKLILNDKEIEVYGDGTSKRDYTFVTDIVSGILAALDKNLEFEVFNLGNSHPTELNHFIFLIENALEKKAKKHYINKQQGDVDITFADISKSRDILRYNIKIEIKEGIMELIEWYKGGKK
jgi:UDP-glucuronate 4-epimerase